MKSFRTALVISVLALAAPALAHEEAPKPTKSVPKPVAATSPAASNTVHHSGGTDAKGCHKNHATGDYHCHNPK